MGTVGGGGGSTNRVEMCVALRGRPFSSQGCMHIVLLLPQQNHTRLAFRQYVGIALIDSHACDARLVLQKIFLPNTNQSSYKIRYVCLLQPDGTVGNEQAQQQVQKSVARYLRGYAEVLRSCHIPAVLVVKSLNVVGDRRLVIVGVETEYIFPMHPAKKGDPAPTK